MKEVILVLTTQKSRELVDYDAQLYAKILTCLYKIDENTERHK